MPKSDYIDLIGDLTGGAASPSEQVARALAAAVNAYSLDAPRPLAWGRVSEDGRSVPLPPEWTDGVSEITAITVAADGDIPLELSPGDWRVVMTDDGRVVRLKDAATPGAALDIAYVTGHVLSDDEDTIPLAHRLGLASLAAATLLKGLAAAHAADISPVMGAQSLPGSGDSPSRAYAARAADLRRDYYAALGIDPEARAKATTQSTADSGAGFAAVDVSVEVDARALGGRLFRRSARLAVNRG
jgi:sugar phosphate isomerase/epimerase